MKKSSDQIKEDVAENTTDPKTTLAWSQLVARQADRQAQITRLRLNRESHPDVISKQPKSILSISDDEMIAMETEIKEKQDRLRDRRHAVANLESEMGRWMGINASSRCWRRSKAGSQIMSRIDKVPGAQVALERSIVNTKQRKPLTISTRPGTKNHWCGSASQQQARVFSSSTGQFPARPGGAEAFHPDGGRIGLDLQSGFCWLDLLKCRPVYDSDKC